MKLEARLAGISAINVLGSFLFQWILITTLGPGKVSDALFASMTVPMLFLAVISNSLVHVLVPILSGENENDARKVTWSFVFLVSSLFLTIAICLFLTAGWWIPVVVPGFSVAEQDLTIYLTRIQLLGMTFTAINGVQWARYHAKQEFIWVEMSLAISNIIAIAILMWAMPKFGVVAAAWVTNFRIILQTVLLLPGLGSPLWPNFRIAAVAAAWTRIRPLILGTILYKTEPLIDRYLLSGTISGTLSLYYLGQQLFAAVTQVLNKTLAGPMVPKLSRYHKEKNITKFKQEYRGKLLTVLIVCAIFILILSTFGESLLSLVVGYGNVTNADISKLWFLMLLSSGVFVGGALGQIAASSFYATGDTKTPVIISIITYSFYIPLKIYVFYHYSVIGLALLMSIYYMVDLLALLIFKQFYFNDSQNRRDI